LADEFKAPIEHANRRQIRSRPPGDRALWRGAFRIVPRVFLAPQIEHVDAVGAEEEVVGIHAAPLVAAMTDVQARADRPVPGDPGEPMGEIALAAECELAVAAGGERTLPDQAAGDRIASRVVLQTLLGRPTPPDVGEVCRALAGGLGHARKICRPGIDHLLRAMAFAIPEECAPRKAGPLPKTVALARRLSTGFRPEPRRKDRSCPGAYRRILSMRRRASSTP
jgi:hypothetical protein